MIIIIDNYDSFTYNLYQLVATHYKSVHVVRNDKINLFELKKMKPSGIILSPGPGRPEEAGICVELIKECSAHIPLLGVCLGHQAIGLAFGGVITQAPQIVHGKKTIVKHKNSVLFSGVPESFEAGRYHSLVIEKETLPQSLIIEAENSEGLIMAIKHNQRPCFGVQFHPESILTPKGNKIIKNFITLVEHKLTLSENISFETCREKNVI